MLFSDFSCPRWIFLPNGRVLLKRICGWNVCLKMSLVYSYPWIIIYGNRIVSCWLFSLRTLKMFTSLSSEVYGDIWEVHWQTNSLGNLLLGLGSLWDFLSILDILQFHSEVDLFKLLGMHFPSKDSHLFNSGKFSAHFLSYVASPKLPLILSSILTRFPTPNFHKLSGYNTLG